MNAKDECLICSSTDIPLQALDYSNTLTFASVQPLDNQLPVILLLRKVLRLPKTFLGSVLQTTGNNPASWNLKVCRVCHRMFEEASFVWNRLNRLQKEFEELAESIRSKLVSSSKIDDKDKNAEVTTDRILRGRGRKRKVGRPPKQSQQNIYAKSYSYEKFDDVEISLSYKIRKAVICLSNDESYSTLIEFDSSILEVHDGKMSVENRKTKKQSSNDVKIAKIEEGSLKTCYAESEAEKIDALSGNSVAVDPLSTFDNMDMMDEFINEDNLSFVASDTGKDLNDVAENTLDFDNVGNNKTASVGSEDEDEYEDVQVSDEADSDYEPISKRSRRSISTRKKEYKSKPKQRNEKGMVPKAIKMENMESFKCSKCLKTFESSSLCSEHILNEHYNGTMPKALSCPICVNKAFKGELRLRHHMQMRHPGEKLPNDEMLERCIQGGIASEVTYDVVPIGETESESSSDEQEVSEIKSKKTRPRNPKNLPPISEEPPPGKLSIPVLQASGKLNYLVLSQEFLQMPEEILALIRKEDKECNRCQKILPTELQLRGHIKLAHEGENYCYPCTLCPRKFERIGALLGHIDEIHIRCGKHFCEKCGQTFTEKILLQAHILRNHFGIAYPYICVVCKSRHQRRAALNYHLGLAHNLRIASYIPVKKGGRGNAKNKLMPLEAPKVRRRRLAKTIPCQKCEEEEGKLVKFATQEDLDVHVKRSHMGIKRPYPCPICNKRYSHPSILEAHMTSHTVRSDVEVGTDEPPLLPFLCHPCNKSYKTKFLYDLHLQGKAHQNDRPFVCEICSKPFRGLKYLKNHQSQMHHEELEITPYKCNYCGKVLSCERILDDHIRCIHTKNAKFSCPHCDYCCQYESSLKHHINLRHTKSKIWLCPQCPKSFLSRQYLNYHMRIHTGEKPYECQFCQKKFSDKPTYNRHVEAHSNIIHDCPHCGKSGFKTRHALRVHVRTNHSDVLTPRKTSGPQLSTSVNN